MTIAVEPEVWPASVVFNDISWELYQKLLKATREQNVRLSYDDGVLEIMSPLPEHENIKTLIGTLIAVLAYQMKIPIRSFGSTTFTRKSLLKGVEPDECYYVRHEAQVRGKKRLDLRRDPPPDFVVEVDLSYSTVDKRPIYAAMRVPELWCFDSGKLQCFHLRRGKYELHDASVSFPFFRPSTMEKFLKMLDDQDESSILLAWNAWIERSLKKNR